MNTPNERLDFLKWVNANFKKVERLQTRLADLAEEAGKYAQLQDINLHTAHSALYNLEDRLGFLNNELDSAHFVATGEVQAKEKKGGARGQN